MSDNSIIHADDCQSHIVDVRGRPDECTCGASTASPESRQAGESLAWERRAIEIEKALSQLARAARRVIDAREAWRSPDRESHPNLVLEEAEAWVELNALFDPQSDLAALDASTADTAPRPALPRDDVS